MDINVNVAATTRCKLLPYCYHAATMLHMALQSYLDKSVVADSDTCQDTC